MVKYKNMNGESGFNSYTNSDIEFEASGYEAEKLYLERSRNALRTVIETIGVDNLSALLDGVEAAVTEGTQGILFDDETGEYNGLRLAVTSDKIGISIPSSGTFGLSVDEARRVIDEATAKSNQIHKA